MALISYSLAIGGFSMAQGRKKVLATAEYLWLDGANPTQELRSKTRVLSIERAATLEDLPIWGFDGSSTWQAQGHNSDCELRPVYFCDNPLRNTQGNHYLVIAEVYNPDGTPHKTNTRSVLKTLLDEAKKDDPWIGFEQEYTFFEYSRPIGWPDKGFPQAQGPFYCGVGIDRAFGRDIVEDHMELCRQAGLSFYGINAEVMPGQWEFQIGHRGVDGERCDPLTISDQTWLARYLLKRSGEKFNAIVSFENKPISGDWNGAGMHTNFSTSATRNKKTGLDAIHRAVKRLQESHQKHVHDYGEGLEKRLTGLHETCHIGEFKSGISDRGASIRIPLQTSRNGHGHFEDRRPGANADPYRVSARLVETVCLD